MRYMSSFRNERLPQATMLKYRIPGFSAIDARDTTVPKSLGICSYGYNIRFTNGYLTHSYGLNTAEWTTAKSNVYVKVPDLVAEGESICRMHVFNAKDENGAERPELIVFSDVGRLYFCPLTESSESYLYFAGLTDEPGEVSFLNYYTGGKDTALIYTENHAYSYDGEQLVRHSGVSGLIGACMHYDRVFGIKPGNRDTIVFSALLDPFDFSVEGGGGEISLMDEGGKILKLVSVRNAVYIFRENAVYRLTAYADPTNYTVTRLIRLDKPVRSRSVAFDLDRVFFVAGESVYSLSSAGIEKIYEEVTPLIASAENAVGAVYDDTYYLSCRMFTEGSEQIGDEGTEGAVTLNNALFGFGFGKGTVDIMRGADIADFAAVATDEVTALIVCYNGVRAAFPGMVTSDGKFYGLPFVKLWRSHEMKPGDAEALKAVRRIYVNTLYPVDVTVESESGSAVKHLTGGEKMSLAVGFNTVGDGIRLSLRSGSQGLRVGEAVLYIAQYGRYMTDD